MHRLSGNRYGPRARSWRRWAGALAAAMGIILLAACGGGSPAAAPSAGQDRAQKMDAFARCVRDHGVPGFYISISTPISPSPSVSSALKACNHILGVPPGGNAAATSAQLRSAVKAAECMRAHGYPDYPDPTEQNGQVVEPPLPASVDTTSPQFQSATEACNASP